MKILAIDTSCDETSAAVVADRRVLANVVYSQAVLHGNWGGVVPSVAKRAHVERIDGVITQALKKAKLTGAELDAVAVTIGPGLAIALEVGINKAKELSTQWGKPLIAVNHMEGHIYSNFVQNSKGNPERPFEFPYLCLLISGGHTELVLMRDHLEYEVIGRTVDDAVGEALDKGAKILGFGYPGGQIIEDLAEKAGNQELIRFPRPMIKSQSFDFSFSGLKTSLLYAVRKLSEEQKIAQLHDLASSYQEAAFDSILRKVRKAVEKTGVSRMVVGGGVAVNKRLRTLMRSFAKEKKITVYFPPYKYLNFDNAAMIGVAASYKYSKHEFVSDLEHLDRIPRLSFPAFKTVHSPSRFMKQRVEDVR